MDEPPSGAKAAATQKLLDYARDIALPPAITFLQNYPLPDPLAHGDDASFSWKVYDVKLSDVNVQSAAVTLSAPTTVLLSLSGLSLGISAKAHAREKVWPHPKFGGSVSGDADGSSAIVALQMSFDGVPKVSVASCTTDLKVNHLKVHGLSVLDPIIDQVLKAAKGAIVGALHDAICTTGVEKTLVDAIINPLLRSFSYQSQLPLPAPFDRGVLDYHLTTNPTVVLSDTAYLDVAMTGEFFTSDGRHSSITRPTMPKLTNAQLSVHMATAQVSAYPFNTALWTYYSEGVLHYTVLPSLLPTSAKGLLNTRFFRLIIPQLYSAYPDTNMTLTVRAASLPSLAIKADGVTLSGNLSFSFGVQLNASTITSAFSLWSAGELAEVQFDASSTAVSGKISQLDLKLTAGASSYGSLGPLLISLISGPINAVINGLVLPAINKNFDCVPLPTLDVKFAGYRLRVNFTHPELTMYEGFVLIGTDAHASITPL